MKIKRSNSEISFQIFNTLFMSFFILITAYPLLYVAFASISKPELMLSHKGILYRPLGFTMDAFNDVIHSANVGTGYMNTIFVVIVGTTFSLTITALMAYVLSRKNVFWSKYLMMMIVVTMFFNGGLIPFFLIVKGVGLRNSLLSLIIPFSVNTFNLILMRTNFLSIPDSLEESAKLDGASHWTILFKIVVPLSLPSIAVMILFYSVEKWNGWFYASIFIQDRNKYPLQLILRDILISNSTDGMSGGNVTDNFMKAITIKYATIIVATLPIMCVYPFLQKYFVKGMMVGAVKG